MKHSTRLNVKGSIKPKITKAFRVLRKQRFFARQNWSCCQGCGCSELPEGTMKYVFYHAQDAEGLKKYNETHLTWGSNETLTEKQYKLLGMEIVTALRNAGLKTEWNGKQSQRILVKE